MYQPNLAASSHLYLSAIQNDDLVGIRNIVAQIARLLLGKIIYHFCAI